jgi:hypothetical protein
MSGSLGNRFWGVCSRFIGKKPQEKHLCKVTGVELTEGEGCPWCSTMPEWGGSSKGLWTSPQMEAVFRERYNIGRYSSPGAGLCKARGSALKGDLGSTSQPHHCIHNLKWNISSLADKLTSARANIICSSILKLCDIYTFVSCMDWWSCIVVTNPSRRVCVPQDHSLPV